MNSPLKHPPPRLPGQFLDEELNDYIYDNIFFYVVPIIIILVLVLSEWVRFYVQAPPQPILVTIVSAFIIAFFVYKIRKNRAKAEALKLGRDGEREVGQQLEELRAEGCKIFHDVQGEGFNLDHVAICPQGIFTIETKTWRKNGNDEPITFDGNTVLVNGYGHKHPITQSHAQANWLSQLLERSIGKKFMVMPALVFPGWFIDPESTKRAKERGIWLLNPKALIKFIKNEPRVLSDEEINQTNFHLERYVASLRI